MGLKKQASPVLKIQIIYQQLELEDCLSKMNLTGEKLHKYFYMHWSVFYIQYVFIKIKEEF